MIRFLPASIRSGKREGVQPGNHPFLPKSIRSKAGKRGGGRSQDQIIPMKFFSIRRPTAPLFSGWNWTP
jgi:hypothetical protein